MATIKHATSRSPLDQQIPFRVVHQGRSGIAFSAYDVDGQQFFRVWFDGPRPIDNDLLNLAASEFTLEEPSSADLEQRQTDWTNGHDAGVEEGLRVAFELVNKLADEETVALTKLIDAADPKRPNAGYTQRIAARGQVDGLTKGWKVVIKELRRRQALRQSPRAS